MMLSRRTAREQSASSYSPASSGPRCTRERATERTSFRRSGRWPTAPAMPHMLGQSRLERRASGSPFRWWERRRPVARRNGGRRLRKLPMYPRQTTWLGVDPERPERCQAHGPSPDCCSMRRLLGSLCAAGLSLTTGLAAQSASSYLPIDHWAMPYVEHLIRAGVIPDPDPLTRPLKLGSVVAVLQGADTTRLPPAVRATIRQLLYALTPRGAPPYYRADLYVGASAGSQTRGDQLHLSGSSYGAYQAGMRLSAVFAEH